MNAPTGQTRSADPTTAIPTGAHAPHPYTVHGDAAHAVPEPRTAVGPVPAPAEPHGPASPAPRTIRVRTASIIATLTFLVGLGVSMLVGPLGGPPSGGPGGPGGQGGDPGTSQSTTQSGTSTQQGTGT